MKNQEAINWKQNHLKEELHSIHIVHSGLKKASSTFNKI